MMKWKMLYPEDKQDIYASWEKRQEDSDLVSIMKSDAEDFCKSSKNSFYGLFRSEMSKVYYECKDVKNLKGYKRDIHIARWLFSFLKDYDFSVRQASEKRIWYYLSFYVVPDIIQDRWEQTPGQIVKDHFTEKNNRNYLQSLWWYFYLAIVDAERLYSNDSSTIDACIEDTFNLLSTEGLSTDTIVSIVERSGNGGYNLELCRAILHHLCETEDKDSKLLRRVMVRNTFQLAVVDPEFVWGGIESYISSLFDSVKGVDNGKHI